MAPFFSGPVAITSQPPMDFGRATARRDVPCAWLTSRSQAYMAIQKMLPALKALPELTRLDFSDVPITDAGLKLLGQLGQPEELDLKGTKVTAASLKHLDGMKLESLTIPESARTDLGLKHYLAALAPPTRL